MKFAALLIFVATLGCNNSKGSAQPLRYSQQATLSAEAASIMGDKEVVLEFETLEMGEGREPLRISTPIRAGRTVMVGFPLRQHQSLRIHADQPLDAHCEQLQGMVTILDRTRHRYRIERWNRVGSVANNQGGCNYLVNRGL